MKFLSLITIAFSIALTFSSCASMLRTRSSGDGRSGINVVSSSATPVIITVNDNKDPLTSKLVFDGGLYNSQYKVFKYYLPRMYKHARLNIIENNISSTVSISREKQKGWFWIEGVLPWMYEKMAGKLFYYNDIDLTKGIAGR